jgi:predicted Rossmann-fold nucleotide-binding protein
LECFELIEKWKRGFVYYGSARLKPETEIYKQSKELSRRLAELFGDVTTWTGGGPGMMEAASLGAKEAGKIVGGIRIAREAGTSVKSTKQSYLDADSWRHEKSRLQMLACGRQRRIERRTSFFPAD